MRSQSDGMSTSEVEVTNISKHGIWLLVGEREFFLSYDAFPWFKDVPIDQIFAVEQQTPGHFYWPKLDVDLGIDSIEHPERFPLSSNHRSFGRVSN